MSEPIILAIDLGTSGPKVALVSTSGVVLRGTSEPVRLHILPQGGVEQDPAEWWNAICTAARRLLAHNPLAAHVRGIGVTAQWAGTVPVDAQGTPLMRAMIWMDDRGAPYIRRHTGGFPSVQGYGAAKLWTWLRRTGGIPSHSGKDPVAHILYIKHERPDIYRRTYKFLEPKDYINFRLTGRCMATFESITMHWVTDNRDIHNVRYDPELLAMAGLEREKLPDLCRAVDVLGPLTPAAAEELGLGAAAAQGIEVVAGTPDLHSAAIGSGAVADYAAHCYVGTSSWLGCHVPFKKSDILHNMASLPSALPGRYLLINEQETAGACLMLLRDRILYPRDALDAAPPPEEFFARLEATAAAAPAGSNRLLFTPWLHGERSPVDDRTLRGGWQNISLRTTRADLVRAVYEGVVYNMRWLMQAVEGFTRRPLDCIHLVGGGAQSALWCQIHADILNRPILQAAEPMYTNVQGAGFLVALGLGLTTLATLEAQPPVATVYEPNPEHRAIYDDLFGEFLAIHRQNRAIYARLNHTTTHAKNNSPARLAT
jgi:xylulokinase